MDESNSISFLSISRNWSSGKSPNIFPIVILNFIAKYFRKLPHPPNCYRFAGSFTTDAMFLHFCWSSISVKVAKLLTSTVVSNFLQKIRPLDNSQHPHQEYHNLPGCQRYNIVMDFCEIDHCHKLIALAVGRFWWLINVKEAKAVNQLWVNYSKTTQIA